jgi:Glycosyl transferase family 2
MNTALQWIMACLGVAASLLWLGQLLALIRHRGSRHWLAEQADTMPEGGWPGLTVIFAARDEAAGVEAATRSILAQEYPALEIVAVDDRSTDATGAILDRLGREDPRLKVVHVRELEPGWLGKTHAMHAAAAAATSPWILFTDADVDFAPGALRRAVAWAEGDGADHLTAVPEFVAKSVAERIFLAMFNLAFASRVLGGRVEAPGGRSHLGIGAFNLVRSDALQGIGGFEHLRLSVDDDNRLAQALKAAGYRGRDPGPGEKLFFLLGLPARARCLRLPGLARSWLRPLCRAIHRTLVGPGRLRRRSRGRRRAPRPDSSAVGDRLVLRPGLSADHRDDRVRHDPLDMGDPPARGYQLAWQLLSLGRVAEPHPTSQRVASQRPSDCRLSAGVRTACH